MASTGRTEAMREALGKRGVPDLTASLAAELGIPAFHRAFDPERIRKTCINRSIWVFMIAKILFPA